MSEIHVNLIVLVVNALHGLLAFYGKDYTMLNVDGLFGLRIIEGQLKRFQVAEYHDIPLEVIQAVQLLSSNASKLANMALPHVYDDDPVYFKKFKYLLHRPWDISKEYRFTNKRLVWPAHMRQAEGCIDEKSSDECVSQLMDAASTISDGGKEDTERGFGCNHITKPCLQRMMKMKGCYGYSISHQLLYVAVAELVGCTVVVDDYAKSIGYTAGVSDFATEFCSNLRKDLELMGQQPKSVDDEHGGFHIDPNLEDLFMEIQFICGQFGFVEFIRRDWLEAALTWQHPSGCYSNQNPSSRGNSVEERGPKRKLLLEKDLADDCAAHKSAVAAGALAIYLRFLIEPLPDEFDHLRLDAQPGLHRSIPLGSKFWSAPVDWTFDRDHKDGLAPMPRRGLPSDETLFWFLPLALFFLYVSYRLCRRQNLRYARWRGLKWR